MNCDVVGLEIDHLIDDVAWLTDLYGFAVGAGHAVGLRSGCHYDKLEVVCACRHVGQLEVECFC